MSETTQTDQPAKKRLSRTNIWIGLSFLLSFAILMWSFTLPFRQNDSLVDAKKDSDEQILDATAIKHHRQLQANEFREAALALDAQLMEEVREHNRTEIKPGIRQTRMEWNRHVESVHRQLKGIGKPEKGTLEWRYKQELLNSLQDAPE